MAFRSSVSRAAVLGAGLLITLAGSGIAAAAVPDPVPVGPNEAFSGLVNGQGSVAGIRTDCFGPVSAGQTGHPLSGQTVEAVLDNPSSALAGYTGATGRSLVITLGNPVSSTAGMIGTTGNFFVPMAIPTKLTVPCAGTGTVVFTPETASSTSRPASVTVDFISQP